MNTTSKEIIKDVISSNFIMTIGTIIDGNPHLCTVFYVTEDNLTLYFKSRVTSEHALAFGNTEFVAVSIYLPESDYANRKAGIQALGKIERVKNPIEMANILKLYSKHFIGSEKKFESIPTMISDSVASTFYKYTITKAKVLDSSKSVHSEEYEVIELLDNQL